MPVSLPNSEIVIRYAAAGEKFITLDEKEHKLQAHDLLIADSKHGIALAGVMGGLNSEIRDDTTDVVIECAYFDPDPRSPHCQVARHVHRFLAPFRARL